VRFQTPPTVKFPSATKLAAQDYVEYSGSGHLKFGYGVRVPTPVLPLGGLEDAPLRRSRATLPEPAVNMTTSLTSVKVEMFGLRAIP
jgi:hypothetical protein